MGAKQTKKKGAYYPSRAETSAFSKNQNYNNTTRASTSLPSILSATSGGGGAKNGQQNRYSIFQVAGTSQPDMVSRSDSESGSEPGEVGVDDGYSQVMVGKGGKVVDLDHTETDDAEGSGEESDDEETSELESGESSQQSLSEEFEVEGNSRNDSERIKGEHEDSNDEEETESTSSVSDLQSSAKLSEIGNDASDDIVVKEIHVETNRGMPSKNMKTEILQKVSTRNRLSESYSEGSDSDTDDNVLDSSKTNLSGDRAYNKHTEILPDAPICRKELVGQSKNVDIIIERDIHYPDDNQERASFKNSHSNVSGEEQRWKGLKRPTDESKLSVTSDSKPETPRSVSSYDSGKNSFPKRRPSWLQKLKRKKQQNTDNASNMTGVYGRSVSVPSFPQTYSNGPGMSENDLASSSRSTTPRSKLSASVGNIKKFLRSISRKTDETEEPEMHIGEPQLTKSTRDLEPIIGKRIQLDGLSPTVSDVESDMVAALDLDDNENGMEKHPDLKITTQNNLLKEMTDNFQSSNDNRINRMARAETVDMEQSCSSDNSEVFLPGESAEDFHIKTKEDAVIFKQEDNKKRQLSYEERKYSIQTQSEANFDAIHWPSISSVAASQNGGSLHVGNDSKVGLQTVDNLRNRRFVSYSLEDVRKPDLSLPKGNSLSSEQIHNIEPKQLSPVMTKVPDKIQKRKDVPPSSHSSNISAGKVISYEPSVASSKVIPDIHFRKRSTSYSSDSFYSNQSGDSNSPENQKHHTHHHAQKYVSGVSSEMSKSSTPKIFPDVKAPADLSHVNVCDMTVNSEKGHISTNDYVENWVVQSMSHMETLHSVNVESHQTSQSRGLSSSSTDDEKSSSDSQSEVGSIQSVVEKNTISLQRSSDIDPVYSSIASKEHSTDDVIYAPQSASSILTFKNFNYVKKDGERIVLVNMPPRSPEFRKSESCDSDKMRSTWDKSLRTSHSVSDILETDSETSSSVSIESLSSLQDGQNHGKHSQSLPITRSSIESNQSVVTSKEPVQLKNAEDILKYSIIKDGKVQQQETGEPPKSGSFKKPKAPAAVTETFQNILHWGSSRIRKSFQRLKSSNKGQQLVKAKPYPEEDGKRIAFLKEALDPNVEAVFVGDAPQSSRDEGKDEKKSRSRIKRTISNIEVFSKSMFVKKDHGETEDQSVRKVSVITRTPEGYFTLEKRSVTVERDKEKEASVRSNTSLERAASCSELEESASQRKDPTYMTLTMLEKTAEGRVMFDPTSPRRSPRQDLKRVPPPRPTSLPLRRKATADGFNSGNNDIYATVIRKSEKQNVRPKEDLSSNSDVSDSESKPKPPIPPKSEDLLLSNNKNKQKQSETEEIRVTQNSNKADQAPTEHVEKNVSDHQQMEDLTGTSNFPPSGTSSSTPIVPPRRKKVKQQKTVVSCTLPGKKENGEVTKNENYNVPLPQGSQHDELPQECVIATNESVSEIKPENSGLNHSQTSKFVQVQDKSHTDNHGESQDTVTNLLSGNKSDNKNIREKIIKVKESLENIDFKATKKAPPRPASIPKPKQKEPETHKSKPKENYKTKYKGSSLIQSRREDEIATASPCSTERSLRVLRELSNQLSTSSQCSTDRSERVVRELNNDLSISSQETIRSNEIKSDVFKKGIQSETILSSEMQRNGSSKGIDTILSNDVQKNSCSTVTDIIWSSEVPRDSFRKGTETTLSSKVPNDSLGKAKSTSKETETLNKTAEDVKHISDEVAGDDVPTALVTLEKTSTGKENTLERVVAVQEPKENLDECLVTSVIPFKLQPKNRIPLRIKRQYPEDFEVPDDCDSLHSDSTECLSEIEADMEPGFYPAGLFEHVAKMSRLADPEDLMLGDAPVVPPVRIRSNFANNGGRDMTIDTLNLPKAQVKSADGKVPPTIARTPPTPDVSDRNKRLSGAVPPYQPGPETTRKLSSEKEYVKERMRRRDSDSSAATAPSQFDANSNKENTKRDSTPESKERHHHKKSHKKHKKHRRRDRKREDSQEREKEERGDREGSHRGHKEHKKHRSRSQERKKSKHRSLSLDETASESTLVATEVSTVCTEVPLKKDSGRKSRDERSGKEKKSDGKRRSRSHSHKRHKHSSKDSVKSESASVKGRNMRALPHHSHRLTGKSRPNNKELLELLLDQQYEHQVQQEAHMAAKVLLNKAYTPSPHNSHRPQDKKIQELLNDAYPLSQRSGDSARESTSLPQMSPTPAGSVHTEPAPSGRRNPRQRSESPPRAGSALEKLLTEGSLVGFKHHHHHQRVNRPLHRPQNSSSQQQQQQRGGGTGGHRGRWASHPGGNNLQAAAWGGGNIGQQQQQQVKIDKDVLLKAIREEIRLIHGAAPQAVHS